MSASALAETAAEFGLSPGTVRRRGAAEHRRAGVSLPVGPIRAVDLSARGCCADRTVIVGNSIRECSESFTRRITRWPSSTTAATQSPAARTPLRRTQLSETKALPEPVGVHHPSLPTAGASTTWVVKVTLAHRQSEPQVGQQPDVAGPADAAQYESHSACDGQSPTQRGRNRVEAITPAAANGEAAEGHPGVGRMPPVLGRRSA